MCGEEWRIEEDNKYKKKKKKKKKGKLGNFSISTCPNQLMSGNLSISYLGSKSSITDSDEQWRTEGGFGGFKPPFPEIPKISVESSIA